jgi:hypothetical protein
MIWYCTCCVCIIVLLRYHRKGSVHLSPWRRKSRLQNLDVCRCSADQELAGLSFRGAAIVVRLLLDRIPGLGRATTFLKDPLIKDNKTAMVNERFLLVEQSYTRRVQHIRKFLKYRPGNMIQIQRATRLLSSGQAKEPP